MSPEIRTELAQLLADSQAIFNTALEGVSDAEAAHVPEPNGWSILGIVEHLWIAEVSMPVRMANSVRKEGAVRDAARELELLARVVGGEEKLSAPERVHPTGKFTSLAEALAAFNAVRENTIRFAVRHEADLDAANVTHPFFGEVSMRQMAVLAAGHSTRHATQIGAIVRSLRT